MIIKISNLSRSETPLFYLCNPGCIYTGEKIVSGSRADHSDTYVYSPGILTNMVGIIDHTSDEELVLNFGEVSELNMRVADVCIDDAAEQYEQKKVYSAIKNNRLIFVENIGFFVICDVTDGFDGTTHYKDIRAESVEHELAEKAIPYLDNGTDAVSDDGVLISSYQFYTGDPDEPGILDTLIGRMPNWSIEYIAPELTDVVRTFEDPDISESILDFLLNEVADAYECIILFDIIGRTVTAYSMSDYLRRTHIHLTDEDLISSMDITENSDDLYTAISVKGNDELTVSAVNPTGSNIIFDFSYYLGWMTPALRTRVEAWQNAVDEQADGDFYDTVVNYYTLLGEYDDLRNEKDRVNTRLSMYKKCRENIVANKGDIDIAKYNQVIADAGGETIPTAQDDYELLLDTIDSYISEETTNLNTVTTQISAKQQTVSSYESQVASVQQSLAIDRYFTTAEYAELISYISEGEYTDEYISVTDSMTQPERLEQMKTLFDRARSQMKRISSPTQEFNVDVESFVFLDEFKEWTGQLETGSSVFIEVTPGDVAEVFLTSVELNYDDKRMSLTFGNRINRYDLKSLYKSALGDIQKTLNTLDYITWLTKPLRTGEFAVLRESLQKSRDITLEEVLSSENEEVRIDSSGYTGRRYNPTTGMYDPEQIKITGKNIVFTDDAWETAKTAIGNIVLSDNETAYGINAEVLIGNLIVGSELHIINSSGQDMFTVTENSLKSYIDNSVTSLLGTIQNTYSTIEQTNSKISLAVTQVNDYTDTVFSTVESTLASDISDAVDDAVGDAEDYIDGEITTIATSISELSADTQEIVSSVNSVREYISETEDGYREYIFENYSTITQTQNSITLAVQSAVNQVNSDFAGTNGYRASLISLFDDKIEQAVQSAKTYTDTNTANAQSTLETSISTLTQTANGISAQVQVNTSSLNGKLDHTHTSTSFGWDLTTSGFTINGSSGVIFRCDEDGVYVNGSGTFNGTIYATSGTIGGWDITSTSIKYGGGWMSRDGMYIGTNGLSISDVLKIDRSGNVWSYSQNKAHTPSSMSKNISRMNNGMLQFFYNGSDASTSSSTIKTDSICTEYANGRVLIYGMNHTIVNTITQSAMKSIAEYNFGEIIPYIDIGVDETSSKVGGSITIDFYDSDNYVLTDHTNRTKITGEGITVTAYSGSSEIAKMTMSDSALEQYVNGTRRLLIQGGNITCVNMITTSSRRHKTDIYDADENYYTDFDAFRPVYFSYKWSPGVTEIGFIAEEIEKVCPWVVSYGRDGKPEGIQYSKLVAVLVEEQKRLRRRIKELEERV